VVRKILAGIARGGERYGRSRVVAMLQGETRDLPAALANLSTTGILRDESAVALHGWISACVAASLVVVSQNRYRTLSLTPLGREVMCGRRTEVFIARPSPIVRVGRWRQFADEGDEGDELDDLERRLFTPWGGRRGRRP
jgi:hypothetical protein